LTPGLLRSTHQRVVRPIAWTLLSLSSSLRCTELVEREARAVLEFGVGVGAAFEGRRRRHGTPRLAARTSIGIPVTRLRARNSSLTGLAAPESKGTAQISWGTWRLRQRMTTSAKPRALRQCESNSASLHQIQGASILVPSTDEEYAFVQSNVVAFSRRATTQISAGFGYQAALLCAAHRTGVGWSFE
jgi:hypothetical protein